MQDTLTDTSPVIIDETAVKYGINYQVITGPKFVETNCNSWIFINQGTSIATLDVCLTLQPGASFGLDGNRNEVSIHGFTIVFSSGAVNNLILVRKFYSELEID